MGISVQEQKALNGLSFKQALEYNNYQTQEAFIQRLHAMARSVIAEFGL